MKVLLIALLLLSGAAISAQDPLVWRGEEQVLALFDSPCTSKKVLQFIREDKRAAHKKAAFAFMGLALEACWIEVPLDMTGGEQYYGVIDEQGDPGFLPAKAFKREKL